MCSFQQFAYNLMICFNMIVGELSSSIITEFSLYS